MIEKIDSKRIGRNIKQLRKVNNLTQEELADKIGYSKRHIIRIESKGTMNLEVINFLATVFNVSVMSILSN